MASRSTSHWESRKLDELRSVARREFGIDPRGKRKADLIHEMRVAFWKAEKKKRR